MYEEDRYAAERVLRMLLVGATFVGAHWYGTFIAVLARSSSTIDGKPYDVNFGEVYLSIESGFAQFAVRPEILPDRIQAVPEIPLPERAATIARLANDPIDGVTLGNHHPHLILTFESGQVLLLDGSDTEFESWTVQTTGCSGGDWIIVATPGNEVAVFDPAQVITHQNIGSGSLHDVLTALITDMVKSPHRIRSAPEAE